LYSLGKEEKQFIWGENFSWAGKIGGEEYSGKGDISSAGHFGVTGPFPLEDSRQQGSSTSRCPDVPDEKIVT